MKNGYVTKWKKRINSGENLDPKMYGVAEDIIAVFDNNLNQLLDKEKTRGKPYQRIPSRYLKGMTIKNIMDKVQDNIFILELRFEKYLKKGHIDNRLKEVFQDNKYPLSNNAKMKKNEVNKWEIVDGLKRYFIEKTDTEIKVWKKVSRDRVTIIMYFLLYRGFFDREGTRYFPNWKQIRLYMMKKRIINQLDYNNPWETCLNHQTNDFILLCHCSGPQGYLPESKWKEIKEFSDKFTQETIKLWKNDTKKNKLIGDLTPFEEAILDKGFEPYQSVMIVLEIPLRNKNLVSQ